jgi:flagellar biosynthetic protein FliO
MTDASTLMIFLRMIASLGAVVCLIFAISWFIKKYLKPDQWLNKNRVGSLRITETMPIDQKKKLIVVEWETRKLLVGVSEASVQLLGTHEMGSARESGTS